MTDKDLQKAREEAARLKLNGAELLLETKDETIMHVCNGIGPEWFPADLRKAIDALHPSLKTVAIIHDLAYYFGDGTAKDFKKANADFAANGVKIADDRYGWYNPLRYIARHEARKFAKLCDIAGSIAYSKAIKEREEADNASD
jgi:hypothetical protein